MISTKRPLCAVADVPPGSMLAVASDGRESEILVCNVAGKIYLVNGICTHGASRLCEGDLLDSEVVCPLHAGRFDVKTGRATRRPAKRALMTYDSVVENGNIFLDEAALTLDRPESAKREHVTRTQLRDAASDMEVEPNIDGNHCSINCFQWGEANQNPIILIHGLRAYARWFDGLAQELSSDHYVVAPDLRGRGASAHSEEGDYRLDTYVDDLEDLVEDIKAENVTLIGHSLGALVAMFYAARHPESVSRLVLIEAGTRLESAGLERIRREAASTPDSFPSWDAARAFVADRHPTNDKDRFDTRLKWMLKRGPGEAVEWRFDPRILLSVGEGPPRLWRALERIACPTLFLRGSRSDILTEETCLAMKARLNRSEYAEIWGGHMLLDDNLRGSTEIVRRFLQTNGRSA